MPVTAQATASGRQLYVNDAVPTTRTVAYTAPAASANVTSPSATAYIKEIIIANYGSITVNVNIWAGGIGLLRVVPIAANDTKVLSGLNTMIPAGGTIEVQTGTPSAISMYISGVEIQ